MQSRQSSSIALQWIAAQLKLDCYCTRRVKIYFVLNAALCYVRKDGEGRVRGMAAAKWGFHTPWQHCRNFGPFYICCTMTEIDPGCAPSDFWSAYASLTTTAFVASWDYPIYAGFLSLHCSETPEDAELPIHIARFKSSWPQYNRWTKYKSVQNKTIAFKIFTISSKT